MQDERTAAFLAKAGWQGAKAGDLAGDASARRYARLHKGTQSAVLMSDPDGNVRPFLRLAEHLGTNGFSTPRILAADHEAGLVLMEDLGDDLLADLAEQSPQEELDLYLAATDVLVALHTCPLPEGLAAYGPAEMAEMIAPLAEFYAPAVGAPFPHAEWLSLKLALEESLRSTDMPPAVMIHRDYHAENLLWLPDRSGFARVGVLDFQDALLGHPAYDLASLLGDVRRTVPLQVREASIIHYLAETGTPEAEFRAGLAAQGAQRNLRILGLFARLCTRLGKPGYLDFMPRLWANLQADLAQPALSVLREAVADLVPEPTPERIARIRGQAA